MPPSGTDEARPCGAAPSQQRLCWRRGCAHTWPTLSRRKGCPTTWRARPTRYAGATWTPPRRRASLCRAELASSSTAWTAVGRRPPARRGRNCREWVNTPGASCAACYLLSPPTRPSSAPRLRPSSSPRSPGCRINAGAPGSAAWLALALLGKPPPHSLLAVRARRDLGEGNRPHGARSYPHRPDLCRGR